MPWGRKVSLYIWTKSIAAGAFLLSTLGIGLGLVPDNPLLTWMGPILALIFLALTSYLLIADLKRPERFYTILLRPQWRSWLTIGAYILLVYGAFVGLSVLAAMFGAMGLWHLLLWPGASLQYWPPYTQAFCLPRPKAVTSGSVLPYPVHLLVQALLAGAASLAIVGVVVASNAPTRMLLHDVLLWSLLVHLFIILVGELWLPRHARRCQGSKTYTPWPL